MLCAPTHLQPQRVIMPPTAYPHINQFLQTVLTELQGVLGAKLAGLYLYGSLVWGDYDDGVSDADLLAAITNDLSETEFAALEAMHHALIARYPEWNDRLEIVYLSLEGLKTFREKRSPIAVISPGEPFNLKDAGADWLMNWYMVLTKGVTLYGAPPAAIIDPIPTAEFVEAVKDHARLWPTWISDEDSRGFQSYSILTLCRAWYTCKHGEQVSKATAAAWAARQLPAYAALIERALDWRRRNNEPNIDHAATVPEVRAFVLMMCGLIETC